MYIFQFINYVFHTLVIFLFVVYSTLILFTLIVIHFDYCFFFTVTQHIKNQKRFFVIFLITHINFQKTLYKINFLFFRFFFCIQAVFVAHYLSSFSILLEYRPKYTYIHVYPSLFKHFKCVGFCLFVIEFVIHNL